MLSISTINICVISLITLIILILLLKEYFSKPFQFPKIINKIDISGRKKPSVEECIDEWIINNRNIPIKQLYDLTFSEWDSKYNNYLEKTILWKKHKKKVYQTMRDRITDSRYQMFEFYLFRHQTRYKQVNYSKRSYSVDHIEKTVLVSLTEMLEIDNELRKIDYQTTREKYRAKNQRKLMTNELREKIMIRDNYTCQNCGKYMPDKVGLQIDHIIPIKKGGKSVESNLQVLCDRCNLSKSSK